LGRNLRCTKRICADRGAESRLMPRRRFREIEVIDTLLIQGVTIPCYRCGVAFTREDVKAKNIQKEHLHELTLGGPDIPDNCRFSHTAAPCHHTITNGTKATSAGSSKHRAAKANNPGRKDKFVVQKRPPGEPRASKGRPIPSRPSAPAPHSRNSEMPGRSEKWAGADDRRNTAALPALCRF
jgi:hypothetical protein